MNGFAKHRAAGLALAAMLALAGCKTGPDYARPDMTTPEMWASDQAGGSTPEPIVAVDWWTRFDDPVLADLIDRTVASNLALRTAEARVREARAARGITAASLMPTLDASGSWTRSGVPEPDGVDTGSPVSNTIGFGPGGLSRSTTIRGQNGSLTRSLSAAGPSTSATLSPGPDTSFDRNASLFAAGFDAAWELDVFGGNRRAIEAADADIEATDEARRDVLVTLLAEVALNYIDLRSAQTRVDITNRNIAAQRETVRLTRARFDAGLSSELDAIRAEALLASTESQLPLLETAAQAAIHRLSVLMAEPPGALKLELTAEMRLPEAPERVPVGLPSDLLRRRPDIRRAERELAASTARIGVATAELFPKFYLTGSVGGQDAALGNVAEGANLLWSVGPSVRWPVFSGGRIRANIDVQNARQEQALLGYEQTILYALEDVENGLVAFAQEQIRHGSLAASASANREAVRLANERYVRGLSDFLDVLQAQQQLFLSEDQLIQSESFVLTSLIALYKALGGGWEQFEPSAEAPAMAGSDSAAGLQPAVAGP